MRLYAVKVIEGNVTKGYAHYDYFLKTYILRQGQFDAFTDRQDAVNAKIDAGADFQERGIPFHCKVQEFESVRDRKQEAKDGTVQGGRKPERISQVRDSGISGVGQDLYRC